MQSETLVEEFSRLVREYKQDDGPGGIEAWNLIADFAVDNAEAIEAALSAAEPQPAPSVAVKALEWKQRGEHLDTFDASVFGLNYVVTQTVENGDWHFWLERGVKALTQTKHSSAEKAKAAAQADYEARIRSALPAQVQDVAGWQPIETAPKDGTTILGYGEEPCRRGGSHVRETRWEFYGEGSIAKELFKKGEGPSGSWGWQEPIHNWASSWEPTHWQPLPAAPAKQEG